jgi:hypothetical protein
MQNVEVLNKPVTKDHCSDAVFLHGAIAVDSHASLRTDQNEWPAAELGWYAVGVLTLA